MLRLIILLLLNLLFATIVSQNVLLTSEERAYLYHVTEKSPTLKRNIEIGRASCRERV